MQVQGGRRKAMDDSAETSLFLHHPCGGEHRCSLAGEQLSGRNRLEEYYAPRRGRPRKQANHSEQLI